MKKPASCLFDLWQAESAPLFHTSELWPLYNSESIKKFCTDKSDQPTPTTQINNAKAILIKKRVEHFLNVISSFKSDEFVCLPAYVEFEKHRLMALEIFVNADDPDKVNVYNDKLFGKLSEIYQKESLEYLKFHVSSQVPTSKAVAKLQLMLLDTWKDVDSNEGLASVFSQHDSYRSQLQPLVQSKFSFINKLLSTYENLDTLDSEILRDILQKSINLILVKNDFNWQAIVRDGVPNIFIDYDKSAIVIPAGRRYSRTHIVALIVHEIGVHIVRSVNGRHSMERLAGFGMAGYGPAEEALGVLMGGATDNRTHAIIPFGIIDFANRFKNTSFRQVHELTKALIIVSDNPDEHTLKNKDYEYSKIALLRTLRILRLGTTTVMDRSSTKYWRGLLLLTKYFEKRGISENTLNEFYLGKYDVFASDQLKLIKTHKL